MATTLQMVRLRAGFYCTRDAQWRIVRRKYLNGQVTHWHAEKWSASERRYIHQKHFHLLARARQYVAQQTTQQQQRAGGE